MNRFFVSWILLLVLFGCQRPHSQDYRDLYNHLENVPRNPVANWSSDYYLVIFVNARHLDYTNNISFLKTLITHPSDGSTTRDFGHVWIYLHGRQHGLPVSFYGGHSGELGQCQAKYFDGIMNYIDYGYANPTHEQLKQFKYEPNPIKYLWETQKDGYFEWGAGMHSPTYAAKIDLTQQQYERILEYIQNYPVRDYSLTGNQCSSFASNVASFAGVNLECNVTISIDPVLYWRGEKIRFWEDSFYSQLTISSPDMIERSLMRAVQAGQAEFVEYLYP